MGGGCFSDGGGFIFKWGVHPMGRDIGFNGGGGGGSKKIVGWGVRPGSEE